MAEDTNKSKPGPTLPAPNDWPDAPGEWMRMHERLTASARAAMPQVVFLGDSITQSWDPAVWAEHWAPLGAVNMGIGGDQTQQILWRLEQGALEGLDPRLVVLMIGVNNLWNMEWSADEVAAGIAQVVERLQRKCPKAKVLVLGILPTQLLPDHPLRTLLRDINLRSARLDNGATVRFLDIGDKLLEATGTLAPEIAPDGCHLSPEGYRLFAAAIEPRVLAMLS